MQWCNKLIISDMTSLVVNLLATTTMPHDDHVEELFYSVPDDTRRIQIPGRETANLDRSLISSLQVIADILIIA